MNKELEQIKEAKQYITKARRQNSDLALEYEDNKEVATATNRTDDFMATASLTLDSTIDQIESTQSDIMERVENVLINKLSIISDIAKELTELEKQGLGATPEATEKRSTIAKYKENVKDYCEAFRLTGALDNSQYRKTISALERITKTEKEGKNGSTQTNRH